MTRLLEWCVVACCVVMFTAVPRSQTVSDAWKAKNKRDENRYEGPDLVTPVSSRHLELMSFFAAPRQPVFKLGDELNLSFFLPTKVTDPVRLYAREVIVLRYYWMEPIPKKPWTENAWNTWGTWPTSAVLASLKVAPTNLGILARLDDHYPGDGRIAPIVVRSASDPAPAAIDDYEAVFFPGVTFSGGKFAVRSGCPGGAVVHSGDVDEQRNGIKFFVPINLAKRPAGNYELLLTMTPPVEPGATATPIEHRYCFYHQPTFAAQAVR